MYRATQYHTICDTYNDTYKHNYFYYYFDTFVIVPTFYRSTLLYTTLTRFKRQIE